MRWLWLLLVLGCDDSHPCTLLACGEPFRVTVTPLMATTAQLQSGSLEVCRNQQCFTQSLAGWQPPRAGEFTSYEFPVSGGGRDTAKTPLVSATFTTDARGIQLEVTWDPWWEQKLADGDVYDVVLSAGDGSSLFAMHPTVTYDKSEINGPGCGYCYSAKYAP